jgi:hypothetical protein
MNLRQRIALWIVHILCPRLGVDDPPQVCPDFVDDRPRTFMGVHIPVDPDLLEPCELHDDDLAEWAEYAARHQPTRHHLNRCLKK